MSSELKTNKISPATGTALTLADSGDTLTLPSGATLDVNGTADLSGATMTGFTIPSGQTLTIASGASITNNGTANGLGGLTLLSSSTNSSSVAELEFTIPSLSDYRAYWFYFDDVTPASTGYLRMKISTDGGSSYITGGYQNSESYWNVHRTDVIARGGVAFRNGGMYLFPRNDDSAANAVGMGVSSGIYKWDNNGSWYPLHAYWNFNTHNTTSSYNAFKIYMSTGNVSGGTFKLYGITN